MVVKLDKLQMMAIKPLYLFTGVSSRENNSERLTNESDGLMEVV